MDLYNERYFDKHNEWGKISYALQVHRTHHSIESATKLLSELYSVYGDRAEWSVVPWWSWQKIRWIWLIMQFTLRLGFLTNQKSLNADQCDVVSTVLLRLGEKTRCYRLFLGRAEVLARAGLQQDRNQMAAHTYAVLCLTLANIYWLRRRSLIEHIAEAANRASDIDHPDQQARVYRGLMLYYARMGNVSEYAKYESLMQNTEASGYEWHNTRAKNDIAQAEAWRLLGAA